MSRSFNRNRFFTRTSNWDFGPIIVTPRMLRVLSCITYATLIEDVEEALSIPYDELCDEIQKLLQCNLIVESARFGKDLNGELEDGRYGLSPLQ